MTANELHRKIVTEFFEELARDYMPMTKETATIWLQEARDELLIRLLSSTISLEEKLLQAVEMLNAGKKINLVFVVDLATELDRNSTTS